MEFLSSQQLFYTGESHENIYSVFQKYNIKYHELFVLCCSIGFKNSRKGVVDGKGKEFRSTYFTDDQKTTIYTILLGDPELNITVEDIIKKEKFNIYKKILEEYAAGGMEILEEMVLPPGIRNNTLAKIYDEYIVDIMSYIYKESEKVPF